MKIVYMGTPEFARTGLAALCESDHEILAVVTGEPKRRGRSKELVNTAVHDEAIRRGLPLLTPKSLKSKALHETVRELDPDLIVVIAFRILPESLYTIPRLGAINIHGSLLPKYRGPAPINWALINGETETGLTSFFLKPTIDTGDMILQEKTTIGDDENFDQLYARLSEMSCPLLLKTLDLIESGQVELKKQDSSLATPAPKITPYNATIDFGFPAEKVRNFIRGLARTPGASTTFRDKKVKLLAGRVSDKTNNNLRPGSVIDDAKRLLIQCANSSIEITEIHPEGKKPMDGRSFKNGMRPEAGEIFGKITDKVEKK